MNFIFNSTSFDLLGEVIEIESTGGVVRNPNRGNGNRKHHESQ